MNSKKFKKIVAAGLVLTMALSGGATAALAKGKNDNQGQGKNNNNGKNNSQKVKKEKAKLEIKWDNKKLEFRDVDMDWARQHIASLAAKGVFEGYADGTFQPNKPVTRLEALVTAVRLMDLRAEAESKEKMSIDLHLKDEKSIDAWARGYVAVALEQDLFFENTDKLQPEKSADRLWVTTMLVKALGLEAEARSKMNSPLSFKDAKQIPAGSVGYVAVAVERGIVKGYDNNTFQPNKPVTRAEIAAFLDRTGEHMPGHQPQGTLKTAITDGKLRLQDGTVYDIDDDAYVFYKEQRLKLGDLKAGDTISFITYNNTVIFIKLIKKADGDAVKEVTKRGTLSSGVANSTLYIYTGNGLELIPIHADADIYRSGVKVTKSALRAGDSVQVRVVDGKAVHIKVEKRIEQFTHFNGTVVSVDTDDEEIVITRGSTNTVYEVDDDALVYRDGKKAKLTDLRKGDEVFVKMDDDEIIYIQVTQNVEQSTFTVRGSLESISLDTNGKLSKITVRHTVNGSTQVSIYNVSSTVKITGDASDLILGQDVELKGSQRVVTEIKIVE